MGVFIWKFKNEKPKKFLETLQKKKQIHESVLLVENLMEMFHIVLDTEVRIQIHRSLLQVSQSCSQLLVFIF